MPLKVSPYGTSEACLNTRSKKRNMLCMEIKPTMDTNWLMSPVIPAVTWYNTTHFPDLWLFLSTAHTAHYCLTEISPLPRLAASHPGPEASRILSATPRAQRGVTPSNHSLMGDYLDVERRTTTASSIVSSSPCPSSHNRRALMFYRTPLFLCSNYGFGGL